FDGVIVTDELSMGAIEDFTGSANAAVQAVKAGNDLLCVTDYASSIEAVISAVQSGEITEERIDGSVLRLLRMKAEFGILS
ncbi:MAG: beta-hexosaminidase, partial [Oscillospiraceae bacterium]|nr:beta-hexosaminidase [Oscillospiraceae bacterium]